MKECHICAYPKEHEVHYSPGEGHEDHKYVPAVCKHCGHTFRCHLVKINQCPTEADAISGRTSGKYLSTTFENEPARVRVN